MDEPYKCQCESPESLSCTFEKKSPIKLTSTEFLLPKEKKTYLACEHIWHSGQDYQMRFLRTSGKKKINQKLVNMHLHLIKSSVIVSLFSSPDRGSLIPLSCVYVWH